MGDARLQRLESLFHKVLQVPTDRRVEYIDQICGDDESLKRDLQSLVAREPNGDTFLASPAEHAMSAVEPRRPLGAWRTGQHIGHYIVGERLGAGGMGEIYRARDAKLGRDVALKLLPPEFAADAAWMSRFEQEARLLASLNHRNIATIYGIEAADGAPAIAMELVDGTDLAETIRSAVRRTGRGLPVQQTLTVAAQLAHALDAAHERGIVHRDLKPANIMVTRDGDVKVLDFGLAKLVESAAAAPRTAGPTLTVVPTRPGIVVGTAAYMSPEQARGQTVDKRTDIWAFGCVVYELLTGHAAFGRQTLTDTLAAVIDADPDLTRLPSDAPWGLVALVRHCLEKDPKRRLRDIGDVRAYLDPQPGAAASVDVRKSKRRLFPIVVSGFGVLAIVIASLWWFSRSGGATTGWWSHSPIQFPVDPIGFPDSDQTPIALSPDGSQLAWAAAREGRPATLWIQSLAGGTPREVMGTEGASGPFWSPDGLLVGFFTATKLNTVDLKTGLATTVADLDAVVSGGSWGPNGIVYSARYAMLRVPAGGGTAATVASLNPQFHENSLRYPHFLPDGRHFVYVARSGRPQESAAYVGSLDGTATRLFPTSTEVTYAAPGYLVYGRDNLLVARRFNAATLELGSDVQPIAPYRAGQTTGMDGNFAVAAGVLAYLKEPTLTATELWWLDRSGHPVEQLATAVPGVVGNFRIAPDGMKVAADFANTTSTGRSVWVLPAKEGGPERVTFEATDDWVPVWSPDGGSMLFYVISQRRERSLHARLGERCGKGRVVVGCAKNAFGLFARRKVPCLRSKHAAGIGYLGVAAAERIPAADCQFLRPRTSGSFFAEREVRGLQLRRNGSLRDLCSTVPADRSEVANNGRRWWPSQMECERSGNRLPPR